MFFEACALGDRREHRFCRVHYRPLGRRRSSRMSWLAGRRSSFGGKHRLHMHRRLLCRTVHFPRSRCGPQAVRFALKS